MRRRFYYEYTWDYYRKQAQDRTKERFIVLRNGERIPMQDWIKEGVPWERKQKLPLNMELLAICTADVIDYKRAEELLQKGAEPLGYIEEGGWPDNLYSSVIRNLNKGMDTKEDYYIITELFLRYGMDITNPAVPYTGFDVLNPIENYIGVKNDCMLRTMRLLLDHGLPAEDARIGWRGQVEDFVNVSRSFSDEVVQTEFPYYVRMLMLIASYPHVLKNDESLQEEIWFKYNQGRVDLRRFREWDWYDYLVDGSPGVRHSVISITDKKTNEIVWEFGVSLTPVEVFGKERWEKEQPEGRVAMEDAALIKRVISAFANNSENTYRQLYLYGKNSKCKSVTEKLVMGYKAAHPSAEVCSFTGNSFVGRVLDNYVIDSRATGTRSTFISLLSRCDLLVLEGVQDLASKAVAMEKLYIVLDKRLEGNRPFLITGNAIPSAIQGLAPRISAILEGSLILRLS